MCISWERRILHSSLYVGLCSTFQPATVSRCGMIYLEPSTLGWRPLVKSWLHNFPKSIDPECVHMMDILFEWLVDPCLDYVRHYCKVSNVPIHTLRHYYKISNVPIHTLRHYYKVSTVPIHTHIRHYCKVSNVLIHIRTSLS